MYFCYLHPLQDVVLRPKPDVLGGEGLDPGTRSQGMVSLVCTVHCDPLLVIKSVLL